VAYDRDYVVMLSDWTDEEPAEIYHKLKMLSHYYNFNQRTVGDLWREVRDKGVARTWDERAMWNQMRMSDRDLSDVTGDTYTFLMNGQAPANGWIGLFKHGEKVRLRFINAAAMSFFDVRIPGLKMQVVAADGQHIEPVTVDEFRIGVAETYDVIVKPQDDTAYTVFAQALDRSGYARGTLTSHPSLQAKLPDRDPLPILSHADMGMGSGDAHAGHQMAVAPQETTDHSAHAGHNRAAMSQPDTTGKAGYGSDTPIQHPASEYGPHVDMHADGAQYRLDDPGAGLRNNGRRVLVYRDLKNLLATPDPREPTREIQLHLTGNMSRYMWSFDGIKFADAEPLQLAYGERLRITLVNDTMMNHPIHLHGLWSDLETGDPQHIPRKHTVVVQPGAKISYLVSADAKGRWAYHCHLLYHMLSMFREVQVR
jgi:CopA family copper-resistance protein